MDVEEHIRFIHPVQVGSMQKLYFDKDCNHMLEKLIHPRVFLYVKIKTSDVTNDVSWQLIKRFNGFPEDLENESGFLRVMSPCFQYYIDLNKEENLFVIKDTVNQKMIAKVPVDYMDARKESVKQIMNRFTWVDSNTIRIINNVGFEKLLDVRNDL